MDTFNAIADALRHAPPQVWATIAGLLISWCGTQFFKFWLPLTLTNGQHRQAIRGLATVLAFLPTFLLWPTHDAVGAIWGVVVGLGSPISYLLVIRIAVHYFPWIDDKMSARPITLKHGPDGSIGVKVGDDKTQYFPSINKDDKP
ncbi:MAG: hypothetical protein ACREHG_06350 [Candidatus Saccharimonadales bacterium]